jgi:hypothetical protein
MTDLSGEVGFEDLPRVIPIFPLAGALLLPGGNLPLHIFEPRYRDMVRDSAASAKVFGMIQPRDPKSRSTAPDLYSVGCAGRITKFRESEDGRYYLTLVGVCRFSVIEEIVGDTLYRQTLVSYAKFRSDMQPVDTRYVDRDRLMPALRNFLKLHKVDVDWQTLEEIPDEALVRSLAMTCPFEPSEKQALLEAADAGARSRLVTSLIEMAVLHRPGGQARVQ